MYWRRTRWAALGLAALVMTVGGWYASTRLGPASIDWESVAPIDAPRFSLTLPGGTQRWWLVAQHDSLAARLEGGTPVRVEFRHVAHARHSPP